MILYILVAERKEDTQKNLQVLKAVVDKWETKMHSGAGKTKVWWLAE